MVEKGGKGIEESDGDPITRREAIHIASLPSLDLGKSQMAFRRIFEYQRSSLVDELLELRRVVSAQGLFFARAQEGGASYAPISGKDGGVGGAGIRGCGSQVAVRDGADGEPFLAAHAIAGDPSRAAAKSSLAASTATAQYQGFVAPDAQLSDEMAGRAKSVIIGGANCCDNGDVTTPLISSLDVVTTGASDLPSLQSPLPAVAGGAVAAAAVTTSNMRVISVKLRSERVEFLVPIATIASTDSGQIPASFKQQPLLTAAFPAKTKPLRIEAKHAKSKKRKPNKARHQHHHHGTVSHSDVFKNDSFSTPGSLLMPFILMRPPSSSLLHGTPKNGPSGVEWRMSSRDTHEKFATEDPDGQLLQLSHFSYTNTTRQEGQRGRERSEARTGAVPSAVTMRGGEVGVGVGRIDDTDGSDGRAEIGGTRYRATHLWPWLDRCVDLAPLSQWRDERSRSIGEVGLL